ncbi:MAG: hypothetical protein JST51_18480 [Armatimonadetes bacterium]|nr:hypothetical protein [Armatimonadota bacterium]
MKRQSLARVGAITACLAGAFAWYVYRTKNSYSAKEAEYYKQFRKGTLGPIPGPKLEEGDPRQLHYKPIDLGIGEILSVSEAGDILMKWFGNEPVGKPYKDIDGFDRTTADLAAPVYRLRRRDGTVKDFLTSDVVKLTPNGQLVVLTNSKDYDNLQVGERSYKKDDLQQEIFENHHGPVPQLCVTNEVLAYFDAIPRVWRLDKPTRSINTKNYTVVDGSSGMGTVLRESSYSDSIWKTESHTFATLVNGSINPIELPAGVDGSFMTLSPNAVYFASRTLPQQPVYRYNQTGHFEQVGVPPNVISIDDLSPNSQGDYVMEYSRLHPSKLGHFTIPYDFCLALVQGGKWFDLQSVLGPLGDVHIVRLDDKGDMYGTKQIDGYSHVVILRKGE